MFARAPTVASPRYVRCPAFTPGPSLRDFFTSTKLPTRDAGADSELPLGCAPTARRARSRRSRCRRRRCRRRSRACRSLAPCSRAFGPISLCAPIVVRRPIVVFGRIVTSRRDLEVGLEIGRRRIDDGDAGAHVVRAEQRVELRRGGREFGPIVHAEHGAVVVDQDRDDALRSRPRAKRRCR